MPADKTNCALLYMYVCIKPKGPTHSIISISNKGLVVEWAFLLDD